MTDSPGYRAGLAYGRIAKALDDWSAAFVRGFQQGRTEPEPLDPWEARERASILRYQAAVEREQRLARTSLRNSANRIRKQYGLPPMSV